MRTVKTYRIFAAIVAIAIGAGCSGMSPSNGESPSAAARGAVKRSTGSLTFTVYTAGQTAGFLSTANAVDIAPDGAGNMWFTDGGTPAIGRIAADGTVTEFTTGLPSDAQPYSIVAGSDGNMWFSDYRGVAIGEITPSGTITEYDATQYTDSKAMGIAVGAHGMPWIVGFGSQPLLAYLTASGTFQVQLLPVDMTPNGALTSNSKGELWFVAQNPKSQGELVERGAHSPHLKRTSIHMKASFEPCCPNVAPKSIVIGPDGDPWFTTLDFTHRNSRATYIETFKNGKVLLIRVRHTGLSEDAIPSGLASATNALWMTGSDPFQDNGALWHVDVSGRQKNYNLPYNPRALAVDDSGNPWFTAAFSGEPSRIVEVTL